MRKLEPRTAKQVVGGIVVHGEFLSAEPAEFVFALLANHVVAPIVLLNQSFALLAFLYFI